MTLRRIIKYFTFNEADRSDLTISDGARLNPFTNRIELALDPGPFKGEFNLGPDISVRSRITNPVNVKQWLSFQAIDQHEFDEDGNIQLTHLRYRLTDGVDEYTWNGTAWAVDTVGWNDEDDVCSNIGSFPVDRRALGVIVNLVTDDGTATPSLSAIKVAYSTDIECQEDLIFRSLIPALKANIRPHADLIMDGNATVNFDLSSVADLETPYDIVGVRAIYNRTTDPNKLVNLYSSFDSNTKIVTMTSAIPVDESAWIEFIYVPMITVQTGQDYTEVNKVPAIILENIGITNAVVLTENDHVVNKLTGASIRVPPPLQGDLEVTIVGITEKNTDQQRLADQIKNFFGNNISLRSVGLDEIFRLRLINEYNMKTSASRAGVISGSATFIIAGAIWYTKDATDVKAIQSFTMRFYPDGEAIDEETVVAVSNVYWGAEAAGAYDAAFITNLSDTAPAFNRARKFIFQAGALEYGHYVLPAAFGTPRFFIGGFEGGWTRVASNVDVDGTLYDVWQSNNVALGVTNVEVK